MTINTRRTFTADDVSDLTTLAAEAQQLNAESSMLAIEVDELLTARNANWIGWQKYADDLGLAPLVEAMDIDTHPFATANTSYIPQVGHLWNSRWNPTTWRQRNKRTRRDIANLRRAIAECEAMNA